jgi:hypothetical protein
MVSDAVDELRSRRLLTLGRVDRLLVQVGYRATPDGPAHEQFLLDLAVPEGPGAEPVALTEADILATLDPVLLVGSEAPRHYSLHQHRWHTSWGASPGALEIGLLVTTEARTAVLSQAALDRVTVAFRDLLDKVGRPEQTRVSRDAAILRARRSAATTYALDPERLSVTAEEHHASENSWTVGLRAGVGQEYDVVVGLVDGYVGSVRVRHEERTEIVDSVGV